MMIMEVIMNNEAEGLFSPDIMEKKEVVDGLICRVTRRGALEMPKHVSKKEEKMNNVATNVVEYSIYDMEHISNNMPNDHSFLQLPPVTVKQILINACAAMGIGKFSQRVFPDSPSTYIYGILKKYGVEVNDIKRLREVYGTSIVDEDENTDVKTVSTEPATVKKPVVDADKCEYNVVKTVDTEPTTVKEVVKPVPIVKPLPVDKNDTIIKAEIEFNLSGKMIGKSSSDSILDFISLVKDGDEVEFSIKIKRR